MFNPMKFRDREILNINIVNNISINKKGEKNNMENKSKRLNIVTKIV